jgi:hypothetical protein
MTFEDRLLAELKTVLAERVERVDRADRADREPARPRRVITLRRLLAGTALAAGVAAVSIAVPVVIGSHTSAYAVSKNADGSISVKINEFRDPDRLEADLADLGVRVDVDYHRSNLYCPGGYVESDVLTPEQRAELAERWLVTEGKSGFRIYPDRIPAGETAQVRVDADASGHDIMWVGNGPPPPCR